MLMRGWFLFREPLPISQLSHIMKRLLYIWMLFACTPLCAAGNGTLTLENDRIAATFDARTGALIGLVNKATGWKIMDRVVLGQSFELLLPLEGREMTEQDYRYNVVKGVEQENPVIEQRNDCLVFTWQHLKSPHLADPVDVTFRGEVRLTEQGLAFGGEVVNHSDYPVEYVSWPCIGEVSIPDKSQPLYHNTRQDARELFPHHMNQHGYWGVDYPTSTYELPERSYLQVCNRDQGFMVYMKDSAPRSMVITSFELIPGFEFRGVNPYADEIDGELVRTQFKANHVLYNRPGETSSLDELLLEPYAGAWTAGLDLYKKTRANDPAAPAPAWLQAPLTWWKISVGNGSDLEAYARQARDQGVDVLQLRGWCHEAADGSIQQAAGLDDAIRTCHDLGLRVVLETNWYEVNTRTDAYAADWGRLTMKDPFGWEYNRSWLCPLSSRTRERALAALEQLSALDIADGYINTDPNHRDKSYFCFDETHGHRYGEPTALGVLRLDREMAEAIAADGEKAALGYGFLEAQNAFYNGFELNIDERDYPQYRYFAPFRPMIARVEVRRARRNMNMALLHRLHIVYDLNFYSNRLSDYPHIAEYGRQIEALRVRYADRLWKAEYAAQHGAEVSGPDLNYAVYVAKDGKRTVVVANMGTERASQARIGLPGAAAMMVAAPEHPEWEPCDGRVEIAPQSAVVIFEQ